nr:MAG TPA: repressor domain protein [Caudoviricetes sp.]
MQYKGNRVFTSKDMMSILGAKSRATMRSFCKRHGIVPTKLSQRECVSLCDENGFRKCYPKGVLLFSVADMDKALAIQGIGRNLAQANPDGNVMAFSCSEFQQLRVIEDANGDPWFVGKDIAENLGYSMKKNAVRDHVYDEDKALLKQKNGKGIVILNENGSKGESRSLLEKHSITENDSKRCISHPLENRSITENGSKGSISEPLGNHGTNESNSKVRELHTIENPFPSPINITGLNVPPRGLTIINESGMYSLIFGSKLESARRFKHWVTSEVLPSIRRTGSYSMKESNDSTSNTIDEKLDEIMQQIKSIKAYLITRDTAQVLVSREMMKQ